MLVYYEANLCGVAVRVKRVVPYELNEYLLDERRELFGNWPILGSLIW
jgi:hypothetical protein